MSVDALKHYADLYENLPSVRGITADGHIGALLLSGEDDDGLCVLARIAACKLCGLPVSRAFDEHADIVVYPKPPEAKKAKGKKGEGEKSKRYAISVDDIKELVDSLYLTPFELDRRVFIIENAESMSEICQNKLLKSLEEPPERVCFILCASKRLLPTVESRCNRIELAPFAAEQAISALSRRHADAAAVRLAVQASRGNLGLAESILADPEFAGTFAAAKRILALATGSRMFAKTAAVYEKFSRDTIDSALGIMEYLLADVARLLSGAPTVFDKADITEVSAGFTPLSAALCAEHVRTARKHNAANCMPSALMDALILKIMEVKALCLK